MFLFFSHHISGLEEQEENKKLLCERRGAERYHPWKLTSGRVVGRTDGLLRTEMLTTEKTHWTPSVVVWTSCPLAASSPCLPVLQHFKKTQFYPQMPGQWYGCQQKRGRLVSICWGRKLRTAARVKMWTRPGIYRASKWKPAALLRTQDAKNLQTSQGGHCIFVPLDEKLQ